MELYQAFVLGLFQGLTEFLPVSSSGHLVIGQKLFHLSQPPVFFDILVHMGTLLSIVIYLRRRLLKFYFNSRHWPLIIIGSIPAALAGFFLNDYLITVFDSLTLVGFCLLFTALLLFSTRLIKTNQKDLDQLTGRDALAVGLLQALALLPGISRSGSTITAGLWRGLKHESAFLFSFFLGLPAMLGAFILQLPDLSKNHIQLLPSLLGLITALISGLLALKILEKILISRKLFYFAFYCLLAGFWILI